jgi:phosphoribosylanthranilate isomerase
VARRAQRRPIGTDLVLVDAASPGSGKVFDWTLIDELPAGLRYILAGGLTPDNVANAVSVASRGASTSSSEWRSRPGRRML